ncbi:MAG TPA: AMP-binding protein, partial [Rhizomicrobium sp.]|nr:AMP-binding protein [Rhizomicrobium sp.]
AALMGYSNILAGNMGRHPVLLWTLPMFHCNGWCFPWTLSVNAGTHVCLRWVRAGAIYKAIAEHGVTHLCGAPMVMQTILSATAEEKKSFPQGVTFLTAAAPPPEATLAAMAAEGFEVVHVYGLTEVYGPAVVNEWHREWDGLDAGARAALKARQGVRYHPLEALAVRHPKTMKPVPADGETLGEDYERFIARGDPGFAWKLPADEWDAISLNYTSGTTGDPKGVVYHHRGAHLMGYGNMLAANMGRHPVLLWTLPMFHCNGWCFPWSLSVQAGTHVCLRWVRAGAIYAALAEHKVTHLCGAPMVMQTILGATPEEQKSLPRQVTFLTAAAPPPEATLAAMAQQGFEVVHVYGLTEVYGPAVVNEWHDEWDELDAGRRAALKARQGVRYHPLEALAVLDPKSMKPVPANGETLGEVMFRGNIVMKGYLGNEKATRKAFKGGWFHSGDLGVMHPDGYIQLKDRSKDIIISGGENISSIEVENALAKHPAVLFAAVVAKPDEKWGETPCAFIELKNGKSASADELIEHCRAHLAR